MAHEKILPSLYDNDYINVSYCANHFPSMDSLLIWPYAFVQNVEEHSLAVILSLSIQNVRKEIPLLILNERTSYLLSYIICTP